MKRYETRVLVEESEAGVSYYSQYKCKYFWVFPLWEFFDLIWSTDDIRRAVARAYKSSHVPGTKEFAELQCEAYQELCDERDERVRLEKLHQKTKKTSYYKHP